MKTFSTYSFQTGSYGEVYKVKNKQTGKLYALKKIIKKTVEGIKLIAKEIKIMY